MFKYKRIALAISVLSLATLGLTQNCAKMKSSSSSGDLASLMKSGWSSSNSDICSSDYAPTTSTLSKATSTTLASESLSNSFAKDKIQLNDSGLSKATSSLKNQKIVVTLNMNCDNSDATSLSAKVLAQAPASEVHGDQMAFAYTISEDLSQNELSSAASADACVVGVSSPGLVKASSLALPNVSDVKKSKQSFLLGINYAHAYQYLASIQSSNTKVKVGMIDTGVDCTHSDLTDNLASSCGYNETGSGQPIDNDGHGSNTAGIVGAVTNNSVGVIGLGGNSVEITAFKVIDVDTGSVQNVINGIQAAITKKMDVINISLESETRLSGVENAIANAVDAGIVVVMAAGNSSAELEIKQVTSPAGVGKSIAGAITVGSIDSKDGTLSSFSNYGTYVEIAAPGAVDSTTIDTVNGIYSTYKSGSYIAMMGTSQASPVITSAAALVIQFFKSKGVSYTPAQIENLIEASIDNVSGLNVKNHGVINFSKLTRNAYAFAGVKLCN